MMVVVVVIVMVVVLVLVVDLKLHTLIVRIVVARDICAMRLIIRIGFREEVVVRGWGRVISVFCNSYILVVLRPCAVTPCNLHRGLHSFAPFVLAESQGSSRGIAGARTAKVTGTLEQ